jgi:hypothetical protein
MKGLTLIGLALFFFLQKTKTPGTIINTVLLESLKFLCICEKIEKRLTEHLSVKSIYSSGDQVIAVFQWACISFNVITLPVDFVLSKESTVILDFIGFFFWRGELGFELSALCLQRRHSAA